MAHKREVFAHARRLLLPSLALALSLISKPCRFHMTQLVHFILTANPCHRTQLCSSVWFTGGRGGVCCISQIRLYHAAFPVEQRNGKCLSVDCLIYCTEDVFVSSVIDEV